MSDWRFVAFLASAGAAGIHFGVAADHLHASAAEGAFMMTAGLAQLGWALAVARGAPRAILVAGAAGHLAVAALWAVSRTTGLPFGPMPFTPEHVEGPDLIATALEVLAALAAVRLLRSDGPAPRAALVLAWTAVASACSIGAHDPTHERTVILATLAAAGAARAVIAAYRPHGRRTHETIRSRLDARHLAGARAGLDARS